jgi:DNA-binding response OmpR family regulator
MNPEHEMNLLNTLNEDMKKLLSVPAYKIGAYTFDVGSHMLTFNSESVKLTIKESLLLILFAANLNQPLLRKDILTAIWREDNYRTRRTMDVFVCKLRKHLQQDSSVGLLNIHRQGYKLSVIKSEI